MAHDPHCHGWICISRENLSFALCKSAQCKTINLKKKRLGAWPFINTMFTKWAIANAVCGGEGGARRTYWLSFSLTAFPSRQKENCTLAPFLPSFLSSFLPSFLPTSLPPFLPSFLPSFFLSFHPSFLSFFFPSYLSFFLPSFLSSPYIYSFLSSFSFLTT